ncbi:MAG: sulfatase [Planctomycetota bacterium]|nr:sulfatase [Planctomycetota bacterium]
MDVREADGGLGTTLRAGIGAACTASPLFALIDALVADARLHAPDGFVSSLGCYAAGFGAYALGYGVLLSLLGLGLHPLLRRRPARARRRVLLALALGLGLFAELYWWTRPFVFEGHSSVSPERLGAAVVQAALALAGAWFLAGRLERLPRWGIALLRGVVCLSAAGGCLFVVGEWRAVAERGVVGERNRDMPNVLLVVVDALRADHLGCYGNEEVRTPVLDALASRGVLFENCFVQAPYTWTSFGSFFTGKYPRRHGLIAQKAGVRMVRSNVTLPLHLKTGRRSDGPRMRDEDFTGGTFMTGALSHGSGLASGFDVYAEAMMGHDIVETDSEWSVFRSELLPWIFKNKIQQRVDSSLVVSLARKWLRANADRRWIAMVHLYSTHTPYDPPREFQELYCDPSYDGPVQAFYAEHRIAIEQGIEEPDEADVDQIRNLYKAGVTQADAMIGELLDELESLGVLDRTLVIVTSDHGEDLGEREGIWEHNHMWQTNLRVPLIVSGEGRVPEGLRVGAVVESVDLLPTVCDLLGMDLPEQPEDDPYALVDGVSMRPLFVEPRARAIKEFSFAENHLFVSIQDLGFKLIVPRGLLGEDDAEALFDPQRGPVRLFDLAADPQEWRNALGEHPGQARRLYAALYDWNAALPIPHSDFVASPRDLEQQQLLNDLGYTDSFGVVDQERDGAGADAGSRGGSGG